MADELVDVVNENDKVIGQEWKSVCHKEGILHRISAVFIFNDEGQLLLQKRAAKKLGGGLLDHSACGHLKTGESYEDGAKKELNEELGIDVPIKLFSKNIPLEKSTRYKGRVIHHKLALFTGHHNGPFKIQEEELESVEFLDLETIKKMILENPENFAGGFKYAFKTYITGK
mgnify:CR=1 FL=1